MEIKNNNMKNKTDLSTAILSSRMKGRFATSISNISSIPGCDVAHDSGHVAKADGRGHQCEVLGLHHTQRYLETEKIVDN